LLIPYAIAGVVSCGYALIRSVHIGDFAIFTHELARYLLAWDKTWPDTICDLWVAPVWFLLALFWARLFFYYLSYTGKWFVPLCVVFAVTMTILHPYLPTPFCIGRGIEALLFMVIGWTYRKYGFPVWSKAIAIGCWLVSMYLGTIDVCAFQYNCLPVDVVGACGGTLVIFYISKGMAQTFLKPFFSWCGRNSLIILCTHSIEMGMTIIHVMVNLLPFKIHEVVYFGIKHGVALLGTWGYEVTKRKIRKYMRFK